MADERKLSMSEVRKTNSTSLGSNFGVPPYTSPYPRYVAGAVRDAGHEWEYVTVDQARAGHPLNGDLLVLLSGPIVPGKYLRSLPISEREIIHHASGFEGPRVFGGPLARFRYYDESLVEPFDWVALRDIDTAVYDHLVAGDWTNRDRTIEEWDRWAVLGADVIRAHPDFPEPLTVELDTSKGCVRYINKGCSFCIEPMYGKPKFREVAGILEEVRRLAALGAVNFRLGGQADFFSYQAIGLGSSPTPGINLSAIRELLSGIRAAAPNLKVLHTDNGDPAMMIAHPDEAMGAMRDLVRFATPGTILSFGLEFEPTGLYHEFRRFKEAVRTLIDHEMLRRVIPEGTVLRDVFLELHEGHVTYGRQIGTYPILVGLPYDASANQFVDVRVVSHGQRSLTAIEYPLDVNRAPMAAISALPGIGAKRAARIIRARPFDSLPAFAASLDDPAVADRVAAFLHLAA